MWDKPLADLLRPQEFKDFIGQSHLLNANGSLTISLDRPFAPSIILWGPPGVGKTTLALLIARHFHAELFSLNALSAGVKEVRAAEIHAEEMKALNKHSIIFIDEIHRFNKGQQAALLKGAEQGSYALIGATTENPSFSLIPPLLSRCRVLMLKELTKEDLLALIARADSWLLEHFSMRVQWEDAAQQKLLHYSLGDGRRLLNLYEDTVLRKWRKTNPSTGEWHLLSEDIVAPERVRNYERTGESHYDLISAFIKSVRGSDPDAAIYYLAWMLEGGEDPLFIARRLMILASEDIGLANGQAFLLAESLLSALKEIGMPEGRIMLAHVTIYLCLSPKSNSAYLAIDRALDYVRQLSSGDAEVPFHLRNAPTDWMKKQGYGKGYQYPHDFPEHFVREIYLPEERKNLSFYKPSSQGAEAKLKEYFFQLWPERISSGK